MGTGSFDNDNALNQLHRLVPGRQLRRVRVTPQIPVEVGTVTDGTGHADRQISRSAS